MTQCSMAAKAWFKFGNTREMVSLEGIEYVDDLRDTIKLKMTPKLDERTSSLEPHRLRVRRVAKLDAEVIPKQY